MACLNCADGHRQRFSAPFSIQTVWPLLTYYHSSLSRICYAKRIVKKACQVFSETLGSRSGYIIRMVAVLLHWLIKDRVKFSTPADRLMDLVDELIDGLTAGYCDVSKSEENP